MNKEETDLIIAEQNKSTEEILKAVAKVKADYHELCKLKYMRIAELEKENAELKEQCSILADCNSCTSSCKTENLEMKKQLSKAKELLKQWLQTSKASGCDNINIVTDTEQFLNSEGK